MTFDKGAENVLQIHALTTFLGKMRSLCLLAAPPARPAPQAGSPSACPPGGLLPGTESQEAAEMGTAVLLWQESKSQILD